MCLPRLGRNPNGARVHFGHHRQALPRVLRPRQDSSRNQLLHDQRGAADEDQQNSAHSGGIQEEVSHQEAEVHVDAVAGFYYLPFGDGW